MMNNSIAKKLICLVLVCTLFLSMGISLALGDNADKRVNTDKMVNSINPGKIVETGTELLTTLLTSQFESFKTGKLLDTSDIFGNTESTALYNQFLYWYTGIIDATNEYWTEYEFDIRPVAENANEITFAANLSYGRTVSLFKSSQYNFWYTISLAEQAGNLLIVEINSDEVNFFAFKGLISEDFHNDRNVAVQTTSTSVLDSLIADAVEFRNIVAQTAQIDGAADWAISELKLALENDLVNDVMIGQWAAPVNRLVAAESIIRVLESVTGKKYHEIARENKYDLSDHFIDTESDYAHFLKQSGISNGMNGYRFDPNGIFTRAQMVTMLGRMAKNLFGVNTAGFPKGSILFSDIPDWADEFVGWAGAAGITNGVGGGRFDSNGTLQNQHTGVFSYRAFEYFSRHNQ